MNCREFVEFLMDYLDRALPEAQQAALERHMRDCPPCVVYLDSYRETIRLGKEACEQPEGPIPEDVPEELVRAILDARQR